MRARILERSFKYDNAASHGDVVAFRDRQRERLLKAQASGYAVQRVSAEIYDFRHDGERADPAAA